MEIKPQVAQVEAHPHFSQTAYDYRSFIAHMVFGDEGAYNMIR